MKALPGDVTVKEPLAPFAGLEKMSILMTKQGNILNFIGMDEYSDPWQGDRCPILQLSDLTGKTCNPFKSADIPGKADTLNNSTK